MAQTQTLEFVVGSGIQDSPSASINTWQIELFRYSLIRSIIVNGVPLYQSNPTPNYIHNYADGMVTTIKLDGTPNNWVENDKISLTITQS